MSRYKENDDIHVNRIDYTSVLSLIILHSYSKMEETL